MHIKVHYEGKSGRWDEWLDLGKKKDVLRLKPWDNTAEVGRKAWGTITREIHILTLLGMDWDDYLKLEFTEVYYNLVRRSENVYSLIPAISNLLKEEQLKEQEDRDERSKDDRGKDKKSRKPKKENFDSHRPGDEQHSGSEKDTSFSRKQKQELTEFLADEEYSGLENLPKAMTMHSDHNHSGKNSRRNASSSETQSDGDYESS